MVDTNRWCIVGEPRCGSHWLQERLIGETSLDEFTNYEFYIDGSDFEFDSNNFVKRNNKTITVPINRKEFVQKRINQLKQINPKQSVKGILFCNRYEYDYKSIIGTLNNCSFRFIMLERDLFDRALSHCIVNITKFSHRWKSHKIINPPSQSLGTIKIDIGMWIEYLFQQYQATEYRKSLFSDYKFSTVRYENLIEDCRVNNITIKPTDTLFKTWDVQYKDIVTNKDELQDAYNSFTKSIVNYSVNFLNYAR